MSFALSKIVSLVISPENIIIFHDGFLKKKLFSHYKPELVQFKNHCHKKCVPNVNEQGKMAYITRILAAAPNPEQDF